MTDFNKSFTFDFGGDDAPVQAPWDFQGALQLAQDEPVHGTSIDHKIKKRLAMRQTAAANGTKPKGTAHDSDLDSGSEEQDSDDDDDDVEFDDSEDEPLPGEAEEEQDEDEEGEEDVDGASEPESEPEEMDSEEEEEEEKLTSKGRDNKARPSQQEEYDQAKRKRSGPSSGPAFFSPTPQGTTFAIKSFADLNLSRPLVRACESLGYTQPTPIQAACIPLALTGRDICGSAMTGSGKTAAFGLPLLERLLHRNRRIAATYVLILAPARELAVQVHSMLEKLAKFTDIRLALVVGGLSLQQQQVALRDAPEIVVATPGRMIDHLRNSQGVGLEDLQALVLDEADRLLDMGFTEEIQEIVRMAPVQRQTLLFSATMTEEVKELASLSLKHPVRLAADAAAAAPSQLTQEVVRMKGSAAAKKEAALLTLCSRLTGGKAIVFFKTKQSAHRAKIVFGLAGLPPAVELHGDMTQTARLESLEKFRKGEAAFLLATDVAARGLDILGVETVVNFDSPRTLAAYLHRVGRTARAGSSGRSVTFVEDGDRALLKEVMKKTKAVLHQRQLAAPVVEGWHRKIDSLEGDIRRIHIEEREEKELRKAEMHAQKAANMIEHEDEIYARPARTWFQSNSQKKDLAQRTKQAAEQEAEDPRQKPAKDKSVKRMERKQAALKKEQAGGKRPRNALMEDTAEMTKRVKAVKAREHALRQEGVPAAKAGKIAASMVTGVKKKKQKSKSDKNKKADGGLFSGDGTGAQLGGKGSKVYAGGAKSKAPRAPTAALSKVEQNRLKRGGKGKNAFKSKARHKRKR